MKSKAKRNPARIKRLYRAGRNVGQIAKAIGYAPSTGNNRVRNFLSKTGWPPLRLCFLQRWGAEDSSSAGLPSQLRSWILPRLGANELLDLRSL